MGHGLSTCGIFFALSFLTLLEPISTIYTMREYAILNRHPDLELVFEFIRQHGLPVEIHLNRTRFSVPDGSVLTEFLLRFSTQCFLVEEDL